MKLIINKKNVPYTCPVFNVVNHEIYKFEATEQYNTVASFVTDIKSTSKLKIILNEIVP